MKHYYRLLPLAASMAMIPAAHAQSAVDIFLGFGAGFDSAASGGIDSNTGLSCTTSTDSSCQGLPSMNGFFMNIGGDIMFTDKYGIAPNIAFTPAQSNYGPLQYRQMFIDFNGQYEPVRNKKYVVQLQGGIGFARTSFTVSSTSCVGTAVCSNETEPIGNANHFDVHIGAGVQFFATEHIFIKPQFDYHYVPGLTDQFGSTSVAMFAVNVGYGTRR
jgi:opacity protein-like surface antigen